MSRDCISRGQGETVVSRDCISGAISESLGCNLMVPGRAGNRHYARTSMSDPAVCAATTMVALTPPDGLQEEAAPVTPEKEKPPRLAGPRIKPFGDRIRTAEEVG